MNYQIFHIYTIIISIIWHSRVMKRKPFFLILRMYFSITSKTSFIIKRYLVFPDYILNSKQWIGPTFTTDSMAKISVCSKRMSIIGRVVTEKIKYYFSLLIVITTSLSQENKFTTMTETTSCFWISTFPLFFLNRISCFRWVCWSPI